MSVLPFKSVFFFFCVILSIPAVNKTLHCLYCSSAWKDPWKNTHHPFPSQHARLYIWNWWICIHIYFSERTKHALCSPASPLLFSLGCIPSISRVTGYGTGKRQWADESLLLSFHRNAIAILPFVPRWRNTWKIIPPAASNQPWPSRR